MNLLTVEGISKSFGDKRIFDNITFGIDTGDKVGVIGINGTGKSTLLRIIAGSENPDSGQVIKINGLRIGYLPQTPEFDPNDTVLGQVFNSDNPIIKLIKEYEQTVRNVELGEPNAEKQLYALNDKMDAANTWNLESDAKTILTKLSLTDFYKKSGTLSGGQLKRMALARALITPVDLLILDEPTNHIDNESIEWLEKYLAKYKGALLMVTHDRYFLDRVVNKTLEIDDTNMYIYTTNYSGFLEAKAAREELAVSSERKRQNFLRNELEWVHRGAQARSTKQKARLERFHEVNSTHASKSFDEELEISVASTRLGRKTIIANEVTKSYDGVKYIDNFSYIILKHDRIGIVGPNGCGKSTLLNILTGSLASDSGDVEIGDTVKIGVFSQHNEVMDNNQRVIDYIKDTAEYVQTADGRISASQMLEKFLFTPTMQWAPIGKLSGGEKRRLYLLKILVEAPNILFLDEPTNDLDIATLSIFEDYLDTFNGAVVIVSHDRYFLDKVVDRIFSFDENGKIIQYEGGYSDYLRLRESKQIPDEPIKKENTKTVRNSENKPLKMTYSEQKEFETINDEISKIENSILKIEVKISETKTDYVKLQELTEEKDSLEAQLEQTMDRWVYLNELNEEIQKNKASMR
ncbi:Energy-dependent translational throttle protein EttA [bioreactor metagenome]|uniref:Energy-dependent translational throttle protein EttA n=1 Tax=bioreactor metagenome TaxID=1076179 RepID=A0A644XJF7_9ZZZZ|nr:ABC-F family ATP-binding cassette domain-containing protein [Candidatus Metalachnospira sp.]